MSGPYVPTGIFTNGGAPGISSSFLNGLESWIKQVDSNASILVTVNGTTSGSANLYQILQGTVKAFLLQFVGYRNASATEQRLTLPTPFTTRCLFIAGHVTNASVWNGGSQVAGQLADVDGLSASGGTSGGYTAFHPMDFGEITSAFDQLGLGISQASTFTGLIFGIGI
jgi:hypothetical protein